MSVPVVVSLFLFAYRPIVLFIRHFCAILSVRLFAPCRLKQDSHYRLITADDDNDSEHDIELIMCCQDTTRYSAEFSTTDVRT